jgi:hypothetical protein
MSKAEQQYDNIDSDCGIPCPRVRIRTNGHTFIVEFKSPLQWVQYSSYAFNGLIFTETKRPLEFKTREEALEFIRHAHGASVTIEEPEWVTV